MSHYLIALQVITSPQTSYAICLMMTSFRYTVLPSYVEEMKAVKNETEIRGLRNAYLRDGAAYVRWLAWLEQKLQQGYDITEYEAAWRLTEYRRKNKHYMGLAYENISASGPNVGAYICCLAADKDADFAPSTALLCPTQGNCEGD